MRVVNIFPEYLNAIRVTWFIIGGVFARGQDSPFGYQLGEGVDAGRNDVDWIVNSYRSKHDATYKSLGPINGKVMQSGTFYVFDEFLDIKQNHWYTGRTLL